MEFNVNKETKTVSITKDFAAGIDLCKATVTGRLHPVQTLRDINTDVLEAAIRFRFENLNEGADNRESNK